MNTSTYVCHIWYKQASVNRLEKSYWKPQKPLVKKFVYSKAFKDSAFSQVLLKNFAEIFQNSYWEKYTFHWHLPEIYGY